jgi:hypothetical protein
VRADLNAASDPPAPARRRVRAALAGALVVLAAASAGCGSSGDDGGRTISIVIPPGTAAQVERGRDPGVVPTRIQGTVGDTLRIENRDRRLHTVGPFNVEAGQTAVLPLRRAGRYVGACTVHPGDEVAIVVTGKES